jgi:hypothetical protein
MHWLSYTRRVLSHSCSSDLFKRSKCFLYVSYVPFTVLFYLNDLIPHFRLYVKSFQKHW